MIFYCTLLQTFKTINTGLPRGLYCSLSSEYARNTKNAAVGQIKSSGKSTATFHYRATQFYNSVPAEVSSGSVPAFKAKLRKWIKTNVPID